MVTWSNGVALREDRNDSTVYIYISYHIISVFYYRLIGPHSSACESMLFDAHHEVVQRR